MPVDRPTFSESWYRVADMSPRLRSTVQVFRQHFRGRMWHVVQDPGSNQFFRLNDAAYHFVALLDGRRTVADVWGTCNEQLGDGAPTQGEVIQLLGQLYTSNLLQAEISPDTHGLFNRYRKRVGREVRGYLSNLMFARIPLLDPDHFLERWVAVFGAVFSWVGGVCWLVLVGTGVYFLLGRTGELGAQSYDLLNPENLPLLAASFWVVKIIHEFGHAFACKKFGRLAGGGEVHVMGIMFLVFVPLPYVDASTAWAFRSKWHRVVVGAGGMFVELAVAAVAAIVWANVGEGTVHALAYNCMFIASVATLLFNANPLLRFDGYYILSDLLEIPNLAHRSRTYLQYLVKRYGWSVRRAQNPAHTAGERAWFVFYGIASTIYRLFILIMILLFLTDRLPEQLKVVAVVFAVVSAVLWLLVPLGKFARYLATSGELTRVRGRAVLSTVAVLGAIALGLGIWPRPDRYRAEGFVEPVGLAIAHTKTDGYIRTFLPTGTAVFPGAAALVNRLPDVGDKQEAWEQLNPELVAKHRQLVAEQMQLRAKWRWAMDMVRYNTAQALAGQMQAKDEQVSRVETDLENLTVRAPIGGTWISPDVEQLEGRFLQRGEAVGMVATLDDLLIRATAAQEVGAVLIDLRSRGIDIPVEIRIKGRPYPAFPGTITKILPAGQDQLPSAALGYAAGGSVPVRPEDQKGLTAVRRFFEIRVVPQPGGALDGDSPVRLLSGQRVVVRFEAPPRPLLGQWWRRFLQLLQKKR